MPRLAETLKGLKVGIISARGVFQSQFPSAPVAWKKQAFEWISKSLVSKANGLPSLVVVGDCHVEMDAGQALLQSSQIRYLKQVQVTALSFIEMERQLTRLSQVLSSLATAASNDFVSLTKIG